MPGTYIAGVINSGLLVNIQ